MISRGSFISKGKDNVIQVQLICFREACASIRSIVYVSDRAEAVIKKTKTIKGGPHGRAVKSAVS